MPTDTGSSVDGGPARPRHLAPRIAGAPMVVKLRRSQGGGTRRRGSTGRVDARSLVPTSTGADGRRDPAAAVE